MKVLFSNVPSQGHFYPLLPLARAFARRGDQVAVLTGSALAADIAAESFEHLRAGASAEELFAESARRTGTDAGAGTSPAAVAEFFAGTRLDLGGDAALGLARAWQPDLVVNEMFDLVGVFVAAGLDVPLATVSTGPGVPPEFLGAIAGNAAPWFEAHGLTAPAQLPAGRWLLETCPDQLGASRTPTEAERWTLRPEPHRGPAGDNSAEPVPAAVPGRPRVLVTLGSHFAAPDVVGKLLDDLTAGPDALDVEFLATTLPGTDASNVPHKSEHAVVLPFQPLAKLLPGATAALIHGGAGTTLGSLAAGVPLVVWPQGADQPVQAAAVDQAGCGIGLAPGPVEPAALREAVRKVVTDPAYAAAAGRVQQEIAAMTAPESVAEHLAEALNRR
ncbi:glycosyltransferase [Actinoplanes sp. NPDC049596]|uniref:glycosyltransferase n=1 Tax=unclassified Actinoplanes TaxID=2626549 RepID=UPI0034320C54